jgi:hypothetical protein
MRSAFSKISRKSRMELFRHAGAADDTAPREDADAQSRHP